MNSVVNLRWHPLSWVLSVLFLLFLISGSVVSASAISVSSHYPGQIVFTPYLVPTRGGHPFGITSGPDGALWFTEIGRGKIGRITTSGTISEYPLPSVSSAPKGITTGPDGALWFVEALGNQVGRITTAGSITEYPIPTAGSQPSYIASGSDGALWFTEGVGGNIGRITTDGQITEYPVPTKNANLAGITSGPDGALWFTERSAGKIGRITTTGTVTEFPIPGGASSFPQGITTGPDGALWFAANPMGRVTTAGAFTVFPETGAQEITAGPDGALWWSIPTTKHGYQFGLLSTKGATTAYGPIQPDNVGQITTGPDGNLWYAQDGAYIVSVPACGAGLQLSLSADFQALSMNFLLDTMQPVTWTVALRTKTTYTPLFSKQIAATSPPVTIPATLTNPGFADGWVAVESALTTPSGGFLCNVNQINAIEH